MPDKDNGNRQSNKSKQVKLRHCLKLHDREFIATRVSRLIVELIKLIPSLKAIKSKKHILRQNNVAFIEIQKLVSKKF